MLCILLPYSIYILGLKTTFHVYLIGFSVFSIFIFPCSVCVIFTNLLPYNDKQFIYPLFCSIYWIFIFISCVFRSKIFINPLTDSRSLLKLSVFSSMFSNTFITVMLKFLSNKSSVWSTLCWLFLLSIYIFSSFSFSGPVFWSASGVGLKTLHCAWQCRGSVWCSLLPQMVMFSSGRQREYRR